MNEVTIAYMDQGRERYGPESIGTLLLIAPWTYEFAALARVKRFSTRRVLELPGYVRSAAHEERYHEQAKDA